MLVHLIQNRQLKRPLKKKLPLTYMLLDVNGQTYVPIDLVMTSSQVKDAPLATFEVTIGKSNNPSVLTTAKSFTELLVYFKDQFLPVIAAKDVLRILHSQSLTIKYVVEHLGVPRADAKEFIERCVSAGAFKKYYSYWIRTDIFTSWMTQYEEKL